MLRCLCWPIAQAALQRCQLPPHRCRPDLRLFARIGRFLGEVAPRLPLDPLQLRPQRLHTRNGSRCGGWCWRSQHQSRLAQPWRWFRRRRGARGHQRAALGLAPQQLGHPVLVPLHDLTRAAAVRPGPLGRRVERRRPGRVAYRVKRRARAILISLGYLKG